MKQHIKEIIVVEGKNDTNTLQSFFDCDTIETGGDQVNEKTIERVRQVIEEEKERGALILLASHNKDDIQILADQFFYLENGSIVDRR